MPTIPQYTKQVEEQALPGVRQQSIASPALFQGADNAGAMGQGLSNLGEVAKNLQDLDNVARFSKLEADWTTEITQNKIDARQQLGENAFDLPERAEKFYETTAKKYIDASPNAQIKELIAQTIEKNKAGYFGYIGAHAAEQRQKAAFTGIENRIASTVNAAITDPSLVPDAIQKIQASVAARAQISGVKDPEQIQMDLLKETTGLHVGVMSTMQTNGHFDEAKAYFYTHKNQITGEAQFKLQKSMELSGRVNAAQVGADDLMKQVRTGAMTYSQAEAKARENFTGEDRNAVISELRSQKSEFDNARGELDRAEMAPVNKVLGDYIVRGQAIPKGEMQRVLQPLLINPDTYAKAAKAIDAHNDEIRGEQNAATDRARSLANNGTEKQLYALQLKYDMLQNPDKWRNADLNRVLLPLVKEGTLRPTDMDNAIDLQTQLRKPTKNIEMATLISSSDYLNSRLETSVIDGTQFAKLKSSEQAVVKARALQILEPLVQDYQARTGDKANTSEVKKIVDSIFVDKRYRNTFAGITYGEVKTETRLESEGAPVRAANLITAETVAKIPPALRQRIETALKANGYEITPENILEAYQSRKQ